MIARSTYLFPLTTVAAAEVGKLFLVLVNQKPYVVSLTNAVYYKFVGLSRVYT